MNKNLTPGQKLMTGQSLSDQEWLLFEEEAISKMPEIVDKYGFYLAHMWSWGDGYGGDILHKLSSLLIERGHFIDPYQYGAGNNTDPEKYRKIPIPGKLRKAVLERDAYRCQQCGSHIDLCIDHIYPEVLGGEATMENLQALCRSCNSKKSKKVLSGDKA